MLSRYDIDAYKTTSLNKTFYIGGSGCLPTNLSGYSVVESGIYDRAGKNIKLADFNVWVSNPVSGAVSYSLSHPTLTGIPVTQGTYSIVLQSSGGSYIRGIHGYINFHPL